MVLTGIDLILSAEAHMMLWFAFLIKLVVITYQCASCLLWCNHNILLYALCMHYIIISTMYRKILVEY